MPKRKPIRLQPETRCVLRGEYSFVYYYSRYFQHNWYVQWDAHKDNARQHILNEFIQLGDSVSLDEVRFRANGNHTELFNRNGWLCASLVTIRKQDRKSDIMTVLHHELLHGVFAVLAERGFCKYSKDDLGTSEPYCYAIQEIAQVACSAILDSDYPTIHIKKS